MHRCLVCRMLCLRVAKHGLCCRARAVHIYYPASTTTSLSLTRCIQRRARHYQHVRPDLDRLVAVRHLVLHGDDHRLLERLQKLDHGHCCLLLLLSAAADVSQQRHVLILQATLPDQDASSRIDAPPHLPTHENGENEQRALPLSLFKLNLCAKHLLAHR